MGQFSARQSAPAKTGAPQRSSPAAVTAERCRAAGRGSPQAAQESRFDFGRIAVHCKGPVRIQPKLTVGPAEDVYEQEADRVAEEVTRMPQPVMRSRPDTG